MLASVFSLLVDTRICHVEILDKIKTNSCKFMQDLTLVPEATISGEASEEWGLGRRKSSLWPN